MLLHTEADTKKVTPQGIDRIADWLRERTPVLARDELIAAVVKLGGALLVSSVIMFGGMVFIGRGLASIPLPVVLILLALPILIGFVIQAFIYRKEHGWFQVFGEKVHFRDAQSFMDDGDDNWWRFLLLPAWLTFASFESIQVARRMRFAPVGLCAEVLAHLAAENRRVYVPDLEMRFGDDLPQALRTLVSLPGVIVASRETPSFLLSAELGEELREKL